MLLENEIEAETKPDQQCTVAFAIVVYKEVFYLTQAFKSLQESLNEAALARGTAVFIYDNTDLENWKPEFNDSIFNCKLYYVHDISNAGISKAYNNVAVKAQNAGYNWLVFLDQDTILSPNAVSTYIKAIKTSAEVPVKVPVITVMNHTFSPFRFFMKRSFKVQLIKPGLYPFSKYAFINSGLLVQLSFFFLVGGYNNKVKLDFADFLFIERVKTKIQFFEVLPLVCQHNFSHNEPDINKALTRFLIFEQDLASCPKENFFDKIGYALVGWLHVLKLTYRHRSVRFLKAKLKYHNI